MFVCLPVGLAVLVRVRVRGRSLGLGLGLDLFSTFYLEKYHQLHPRSE
jgi:hypothetical protein